MLLEESLLANEVEQVTENKVSEEKARHRFRWKIRWRGLVFFSLEILKFVLSACLEGGRIVREVGPGMKPEERYEFERNYRDLYFRRKM